MRKSPRYRWQLRWHLDRAARIAMHDTGAVVRIVGRLPIADDPFGIIDGLAVKHGHNAPEMLQRMLREVRQLWDAGRDDGPYVPQIPADPVPADSRVCVTPSPADSHGKAHAGLRLAPLGLCRPHSLPGAAEACGENNPTICPWPAGAGCRDDGVLQGAGGGFSAASSCAT